MLGTQQNFSNDRAFENAFLVYIQGVEIPVTSATVRFEVGQLPVASIQIAPDPEMARLGVEDRVEVQIFYKDNFYTTVKGAPPEFCLLYDGTIDGWSYSHNAFGRTISFQVNHSSKIIQDTTMFFLSGLDSMAISAIQPGTQTNTVTTPLPGLVDPWKILFCGLMPNDQSTSPQFLKRPYDLVYNFFKASMAPIALKKLESIINATFLTRLFQRKNFMRQFIPSPILEFQKVQENAYKIFPLLHQAQGSMIINAIGGKVQQMGTDVSLWDVFTYVYSQMYYEIATIPAPPIARVNFRDGTPDVGSILGPPRWWVDEVTYASPQNPEFKSCNPAKPNFLMTHVTKPQWIFGVPPACNVIFPSMIEELSFTESYAHQPTRCYVDNRELSHTFNLPPNHPAYLFFQSRGAYPPAADFQMQKPTRGYQVSAKNLLVWPAEYFRGPQSVSVTSPPIMMAIREASLNNVTSDQLIAQAALDFIDGRLQSGVQIALNQARTETEADKKTAKLTDDQKRAAIVETVGKALLNEESVFFKELQKKGILNNTLSSLDEVRSQLVRKSATDQMSLEQLMRRYAQYEYYRQGAGARSGTVQMSFNPYIVPGFPIVIFNSLEDGNHFVGYVAGVEHQLTPRAMRTSVSFVMGQTLDEYLNNIFDARIGNNQDNLIWDISAAPANPVPVLRDVTQNQEQAESYFSQLFHQNQPYMTEVSVPTTTGTKIVKQVKSAAFDVFKAVRFQISGDPKHYTMWDVLYESSYRTFRNKIWTVRAGLEEDFEKAYKAGVEGIKKTLTSQGKTGDAYTQALADQSDALRVSLEEIYYRQSLIKFMTLPRKNPTNKILDNYTSLQPSSEFKPLFQSYESAMRYVSRPVCTLDDYIKFRGPWGWARNRIDSNDPKQGKGAPFYEKILYFKEGPGDPPVMDPVTGIPVRPTPRDLPDTRFPWSTRLVNYRNLFLYGNVAKTEE